jgi:soluble lytic murein transglycosylase
MSKRLFTFSFVIFLVLVGATASGLAYEQQAAENYIAYRIKYIHEIAYNTNSKLSNSRIREYANLINYWSNYYSQELEVDIDPLLVTAIIETETNFVSRSDYDDGRSIGISSMRIDTARWVARKLGVEYNNWRMLDASDLGIRFTVYYLGIAEQRYNEIYRVIISYNQGFNKAEEKEMDKLYNNYLFKVLGRYNYYQQRISAYGSSADDYFYYKFNLLDQ